MVTHASRAVGSGNEGLFFSPMKIMRKTKIFVTGRALVNSTVTRLSTLTYERHLSRTNQKVMRMASCTHVDSQETVPVGDLWSRPEAWGWHLLGLINPFVVIAGNLLGGWFTAAGVVYMLGIGPVLDVVLGKSDYHKRLASRDSGATRHLKSCCLPMPYSNCSRSYT